MRRVIFFVLLLSLVTVQKFQASSADTYKKVVKVAAFNYYPGIFRDVDGRIKGIWVDLLETVALNEQWKIEYVYGSWNDGLSRLKEGTVDIVTSAAYTQERDEYMDYCDHYLLTVWTEIYSRENDELNSILELNNKKIGLMQGDYNARALLNMLEEFRVEAELVYFSNYDAIFEAINDGRINAGAVNNLYGSKKLSDFNLKSTAIMFEPFDIYFAVGEGKNGDILATLDAYLHLWQSSNSEEFKSILNKWEYSNLNVVREIPSWIFTSTIVLIGLILLTTFFIILLRARVKEATAKLRASEERFNLAMNSANDGLFDWNIRENTIYFSPRWKSMLGYEDHEIKNEFSEWERLTDRQDVEESWKKLDDHFNGKTDRFEMEFRMLHKDGHWVEVLSRATAQFDKKGKAVRVVGTHVDITRRKKIEQELEESLQQLKQAQKFAKIGSWNFNPESGKIFWSEEVYRIFNFKTDSNPLLPEETQKYISPEDWEKLNHYHYVAIYEGINFEIKMKLLLENNISKWIHVICKTQKIEGTDKYFLRGTVQDITREKLAEIALIESEENYKTLYNNIPLGVFRSTVEGRLLSANESMCKMYGFNNLDEFLKRNATEFYQNVNERKIMVEKLQQDGFLKNYVTEERRKDGSAIWVRTNYAVTPDINGSIKFINGVVEDITTFKYQEDALIESERKYREFYNKTPVMLHSTNVNGNLISVSNYWLEVMGYKRDEVLGKNALDFLTPKSREIARNYVEPEFHISGKAFDVEYEMIKKSGEVFNVSVSAISESNAEGVFIRTLAVLTDITERKKAEAALKASEELFRHSFDYAAGGVCLVTPEGNYSRINREFEKITGYSESELKGRHFTEITFIEDQQTSLNSIESLLKGEISSTEYEKRYVRKTGELIWVYVSITLLKNERGEPLYFVIHGLDISGRKASEIKLKRNIEALTQAENIANLGYFERNWQTGETYWSEGVYKLLKLERENSRLDYFQALDFIHPDDLSRVLKEIEFALETDGLFNSEFRVIQSDGEVIHIHSVAHAAYDSYGKPDLVRGIFQDITDRIIANIKLTQKQKLLDSIFDNIPVMITHYSVENKLFLINKEMERITGYTIEDVNKPDFLSKIYPDPEIRESAIDYMNKATIEWKEFPLTTRNGEVILSAWSNILLKDGTQVGIGIDVRERKNAELALIENQRLSAIGEMASAVAHDFNNALQSIFGNIDLAMHNTDLPDSVRKYLDTIQNSAEDASARVQLLQRFGGKKEIKKQYTSVNMNDIIADVIVQSRPLWKNIAEIDGRSIIVEPQYGVIKNVEGNESELRAALYNTVKNAIEALSDGGKVKISTRMNNKSVEVIVSDNGVGMTEEIKARVFQPFFTTKGFEVGRGLGMSGAYSIIQEHKGSLRVDYSEPGKGTVIVFSLPAVNIDVMKTDVEQVQKEQRALKILWVDDEKLIRDVAFDMLQIIGHTGDIAASGGEALSLLEQNDYDLIVTDLGMPGMNGWELMGEIRNKYGNDIRIGVLTGWGTQTNEEKLAKYNVTAILGKPFKLAQFKVFISNLAP